MPISQKEAARRKAEYLARVASGEVAPTEKYGEEIRRMRIRPVEGVWTTEGYTFTEGCTHHSAFFVRCQSPVLGDWVTALKGDYKGMSWVLKNGTADGFKSAETEKWINDQWRFSAAITRWRR